MIETAPWWVWAIASILIAFAELHAPGYYAIWIAVGAGVTALASAGMVLSLPVQILVFAAAAAVSCGAGYFVYGRGKDAAADDLPLNQRMLQMIGTRGTVCEPLANGHGKIRVGDTVWLAEGPDLPMGAPAMVQSVRGTTLIVAES